jgi:hypothetical protein
MLRFWIRRPFYVSVWCGIKLSFALSTAEVKAATFDTRSKFGRIDLNLHVTNRIDIGFSRVKCRALVVDGICHGLSLSSYRTARRLMAPVRVLSVVELGFFDQRTDLRGVLMYRWQL